MNEAVESIRHCAGGRVESSVVQHRARWPRIRLTIDQTAQGVDELGNVSRHHIVLGRGGVSSTTVGDSQQLFDRHTSSQKLLRQDEHGNTAASRGTDLLQIRRRCAPERLWPRHVGVHGVGSGIRCCFRSCSCCNASVEIMFRFSVPPEAIWQTAAKPPPLAVVCQAVGVAWAWGSLMDWMGMATGMRRQTEQARQNH